MKKTKNARKHLLDMSTNNNNKTRTTTNNSIGVTELQNRLVNTEQVSKHGTAKGLNVYDYHKVVWITTKNVQNANTNG